MRKLYWIFWRLKQLFCRHHHCSIAEIEPWDTGNFHLFCDKCDKDFGLIPPW